MHPLKAHTLIDVIPNIEMVEINVFFSNNGDIFVAEYIFLSQFPVVSNDLAI